MVSLENRFVEGRREGRYRRHVGLCHSAGFLLSDLVLVLVAAAVICALWIFYTLRMRRATAEIDSRLGERLQERERIARELHDSLLQDFQVVILRFQVIAKRYEDPNRAAMESDLDYADKHQTVAIRTIFARGWNKCRPVQFS